MSVHSHDFAKHIADRNIVLVSAQEIERNQGYFGDVCGVVLYCITFNSTIFLYALTHTFCCIAVILVYTKKR